VSFQAIVCHLVWRQGCFCGVNATVSYLGPLVDSMLSYGMFPPPTFWYQLTHAVLDKGLLTVVVQIYYCCPAGMNSLEPQCHSSPSDENLRHYYTIRALSTTELTQLTVQTISCNNA